MLTFWLLLILGIILVFGLVYLLSLTPANTICPKCKKRKKFSEHGWRMLCSKCEGGLND